MKIALKHLLVFSIISFVFSCRTIPENEEVESGNISSETPVLVKINFLGAEWMSDISKNTFISENNSRGGGIL